MSKEPVFYSEVQKEEMRQFIKNKWGPEDNGFVCHEIHSEYVHTDVLAVGSADEGKVLVTVGVGARRTDSPFPAYSRIEFVMFASKELSTDVNRGDVSRYLTAAGELQSLSKYPFRNHTWFGPGHTINASDAFSKEFGYSYFLFADDCEAANLSEIGDVRFLIPIPVYEEERDWMTSHVNGSQRFLNAYVEEFRRNGNAEKMLDIDVPRCIIIPR